LAKGVAPDFLFLFRLGLTRSRGRNLPTAAAAHNRNAAPPAADSTHTFGKTDTNRRKFERFYRNLFLFVGSALPD
jgi:hypothetical protein